jgi:hypothetical protein
MANAGGSDIEPGTPMTDAELWQAFGAPPRPAVITQEPFDYDSSHYARLCDAVERGRLPEPQSVYEYCEDLLYCPVQPELLLFLWPSVLKVWAANLSGTTSMYAAEAERFWMPWARHGETLFALLGPERTAAFERYVRGQLLASIDRATRLRLPGRRPDAAYQPLFEINSYAKVFPYLERLWLPWWQAGTTGRAIYAVSYISSLMYEQNKNPVFDPWTPERGGGPPSLWEDSMLVCEAVWRPENLDLLRAQLQPGQLLATLERCAAMMAEPADRQLAERIHADFPAQRWLVELRQEQLLSFVTSREFVVDWTL